MAEVQATSTRSEATPRKDPAAPAVGGVQAKPDSKEMDADGMIMMR